MKFAWKVTLAALCILMLALGTGSYLLISLSFSSNLEREIGMGREEMQMLCVSYEAVCSARGITLENIEERGRSLNRTLEEEPFFSSHQFRVVTQSGGHVYSSMDSASDRELLGQVDKRTSGYVLRHDKKSGQYLLHCAGPVALPDGMLYLETVRDISALFTNRDTQYQVYRWIVLLVTGVSWAVMFALSYWLTSPIRSLGRVAGQLSEGDYSPRARVAGGDEIGELAASFNRMADAIEKNVQELEDAARRQEDFTASFVHELKTPLTSIIGYADILRSQKLNETARFKAASYIFSEGKRLENLSRKLLELLVLRRGDLPLAEISPAELICTLGERLKPLYAAKGIQISWKCEEGYCRLEPDLVWSLLLNLADNAQKAMEGGGLLRFDLRMLSNGCRIRVLDTGRGIPPEALAHLTEAFYRVDKARSRAQGGFGLGLALCREIAALHNGSIRFDNRTDGLRGTCVTVELRGGRT